MKELSVEEKAKRYDEAIKRAGNLHKDAVEMENNMTSKTCEIIFPELKESEDERIRKGIIALIEFGLDDKSAIAPGYNITKEEAIAWLEKQGKKLDADKVIDWLRFHIQVDDPKIEYNEDGQPLAESFIAHAKARCVAADEVVKNSNKISNYDTEDYCSYEVAKLLKEKGFSEKCVACYDWIDNSLRTIYHDTTGEVEPQDWNNLTFEEAGKIGLANWYRNISDPTHQMAMKWLRTKGIRICIDYNNMNGDWYATIAKEYDGQMSERIRSEHFTLYEEAVEAALKYCLTELI